MFSQAVSAHPPRQANSVNAPLRTFLGTRSVEYMERFANQAPGRIYRAENVRFEWVVATGGLAFVEA